MITAEEDISVTRSQLTFDCKNLKNVDKQNELLLKVKVKVNQSLYWSGQALRVPEG
jgi:hypothetical protein